MVEDTCPPPDLPAEPQPRLSLLRAGGPGRFPFCEAENMLNFRAKAGGGDASGWSFGSALRQQAALGTGTWPRAQSGTVPTSAVPSTLSGRRLELRLAGSMAPAMSVLGCGTGFGAGGPAEVTPGAAGAQKGWRRS